MKKVTLSLAVILTLTFSLVKAQTDKEYIKFVKSETKLVIKDFVYAHLKLTDKEFKKFDHVFNRYLKNSGKNELKKIKLFDQYFKDGSAMTDKQLNSLNKELLKSDIQKSRIDKKFYKIFKKILGVNKATTFFFLKKSIDNMVEGSRLEILSN